MSPAALELLSALKGDTEADEAVRDMSLFIASWVQEAMAPEVPDSALLVAGSR